jgi:DNA polymerase kappa
MIDIISSQTGKELLLPELPLTLRLIGLRVTKLKDLRAASPTGGIKRVCSYLII